MELIPGNLKSSPSLTLFKNEIKLWECFNCPCNICKSYSPNLGYFFDDFFFSWILTSSWYWFESCLGHLSITKPQLIHVLIFGEGAVLVELY